MALTIGVHSLTDPTSYISDGIAERGTFTDGAPLLQGYESVILMWAAMSQSNYNSLYTAWDAYDSVEVTCIIPPNNAALSSYRTVTAFAHEPTGEASGGIWHNVRMRISFIDVP